MACKRLGEGYDLLGREDFKKSLDWRQGKALFLKFLNIKIRKQIFKPQKLTNSSWSGTKVLISRRFFGRRMSQTQLARKSRICDDRHFFNLSAPAGDVQMSTNVLR